MVHLQAATHMQPSNSTTALEDDIRWEAMTTGRVDGVDRFVIAVTSTGIYCRIGCPARRPLRKNVIFFETVEGARAAGFRACKKCHPGDHL